MNTQGSRQQYAEQARDALEQVGVLWEQRLATDWVPPIYPDAVTASSGTQVKMSLAALVPGLKTVGEWQKKAVALKGFGGEIPCTVAMILAGNTPLMSWSPLCACLLAGCRAEVKMSREETLWPRLFVESLAAVAPEVAERIRLHAWAGEEERTTQLVQSADAVVAFGSDSTISTLRDKTPDSTPFFGYGHAISIGVIPKATEGGNVEDGNIAGFAYDTLLYEQSGCLSLQAVFVEGGNDLLSSVAGSPMPGDSSRGENPGITLDRTSVVAAALTKGLEVAVERLAIPPIQDMATAIAIRRAQDMARFSASVNADRYLRWSVLRHPRNATMFPPTGFCLVQVIPVDTLEDVPELLGELRGRVSCVAVAGAVSAERRTMLASEGVSRICPPGEMQRPPLDWQNGGFDLLAALSRIAKERD